MYLRNKKDMPNYLEDFKKGDDKLFLNSLLKLNKIQSENNNNC
jgi:hypothetical protein